MSFQASHDYAMAALMGAASGLCPENSIRFQCQYDLYQLSYRVDMSLKDSSGKLWHVLPIFVDIDTLSEVDWSQFRRDVIEARDALLRATVPA